MNKTNVNTSCPRCQGDGEEIGAPISAEEIAVCSTCNGRGEITYAEVVQIQLTQQETEFARAFLAREDADPESEEIALVKTARFLTYPGLEMDIKCVNADSPYVDPVVFFQGQEVESFDCEGSLDGEYMFQYEGKHYLVEILSFSEKETRIAA